MTAPRPDPTRHSAPNHRSARTPHDLGQRILVVDDNADAAEMMAMLLQLEGHEVRVAHDGESALTVASQFAPQVGIFDIGLPEMDGYELARRVRSDQRLLHMYLVAVTGWGTDEDRERASEAGFDSHLTKPAEPEAVREVLARAASIRGACTAH